MAFVYAPAVASRLAQHRATANHKRCASYTMATSSFTPAPCFTLPLSSRTTTHACPCATPPLLTMMLESPPSESVPVVITNARRNQLHRVITASPVFQSAGLSIDSLEHLSARRTDIDGTALDDWLQMGSILEHALGTQTNDVRVYQYYLPTYFWILRELNTHRNRLQEEGKPHRPFILGFSCPQGGGKTTMTTFMQTLLRSTGKNVQIASLDDFYVTNKEQCKIAEENSNNRLMQFRGMPGTHDVDLLKTTLDHLRHGIDVSIPQYDKTAFNGRGDRAPKDQWKHVSETTDVVLLEGWCLGFEPVEKENLTHPDLNVLNNALADFAGVYRRMDGLFIIEISNMDWVFNWRLQAERDVRAAGKPGLSDEQVVDFVSRFMPAYKQYAPQLYSRASPLIPRHELHIEIDNQRRPVHRRYR